MYRKIMNQLKEWKAKKDRLPLILKGARQVGKNRVASHLAWLYCTKPTNIRRVT